MHESPLIRVAAGILLDGEGRVLIARRAPGSHEGGCWEFPGGKLHPDESSRAALERELWEELGIQVEVARPFLTIRHAYPDRLVELEVFLVDRYRGSPQGVEGQPLRWVTLEELPSAGLLSGDEPIGAALLAAFG